MRQLFLLLIATFNFNKMKISDLIEELNYNMDVYGDMEVMSSSDYGDYCHTEQLSYIKSIEICAPVKSPYSYSGLVFPSCNDDDDEEEKILTLRYTTR